MDLPEFTMAEVQAAFERGEWTAAGLADSYLQRISEIDRSGPMLRSIIEVNPDAVAIAEAFDAERRQGGHVVPFTVSPSS